MKYNNPYQGYEPNDFLKHPEDWAACGFAWLLAFWAGRQRVDLVHAFAAFEHYRITAYTL